MQINKISTIKYNFIRKTNARPLYFSSSKPIKSKKEHVQDFNDRNILSIQNYDIIPTPKDLYNDSLGLYNKGFDISNTNKSSNSNDKYNRVMDLINKGCPQVFAMQLVMDIQNEDLEKLVKEKFLPEIDKSYNVYYEELQNGPAHHIIAEKVIDISDKKNIKGVPVNNSMSTEQNNKKIIKKIILDEDGNLSKNTTYINNNIVESWLYKGNKSTITVANSIKEEKNNYDEILLQIEIANNKNGEPEYIIATKPSDILQGAYEATKYTLSDYPENWDMINLIKNDILDEKIKKFGLKQGEKISEVTKTKNGDVIYNEHYSYNGKEIIKKYSQNGILANSYSYEIKNEDGSNLFKMDKSWQKNDDNTTTTIINGKKYITKFDNENFEANITMPNGEQETISISDKCILSDFSKLYNFIKDMPADFILSLKDMKTIRISNIMTVMLLEEDKIIGPLKMPDLAHEIGHFIDLKNSDNYQYGKINGKEDIIKSYNEEMKNFQKENPVDIQDIIFYFSQTGSKNSSGLSEMVADVHTLMFTYGHKRDDIQLRINYLTKYFPETVAKIATEFGYNQVKN